MNCEHFIFARISRTMLRWEVSTEEAVTSLLRSAQEDPGLEESACACAVCQVRFVIHLIY